MSQIPMTFMQVPRIPANLLPSQTHLLIPTGFEETVDISMELDTLHIHLLNDEDDGQNSILAVPHNFYNPEANGTYFPHFLFETSTLKPNKKPNYFDPNARNIFNQNELLFLALQHRFCQLEKFDRAFSNLINNDIKAIKSHMIYRKPRAFNAKMKVENSFIILSPWNSKIASISNLELKSFSNRSLTIGDILSHKLYKPSEEQWRIIQQDLPIHPSSESSLSKVSKCVLGEYPTSLYRSVGYNILDKQGTFTSIFPPASNIAARLKTHTTADAYELAHFEANSQYIQDYVWKANGKQESDATLNGSYISKDHCYKEALVVIHSFEDEDSVRRNRFLYGEIEASKSITGQSVLVDGNVKAQFEEIYLSIGEKKESDSQGKVVIGIDLELQPVYVYDCKSVRLERIVNEGTQGVQKLALRIERVAGNCRFDSNTGLKGFTKTKPNLGKIIISGTNTVLEDDGTGQKMSSEDKVMKPDMVLGMNAFKAKGNGIQLARAALASKLGYYKTPHFSGLLNTCNEKEIEDAANSLPDYKYIDEFGKEQTVQIGIVYVRYTELGHVFKSYRHHSFTHESGRNLKTNGNQELQKFIWDNYVTPDVRSDVLELEKILLDNGSNLLPDNAEDYLPSYLASDIFRGKVFKQSDLVLRTTNTSASTSKLLDEEWNKGFYLDFRPNKGPKIRIPSAKLLNRFVSELDSKNWIFPVMLVRISKMIRACMSIDGSGMRLGQIFQKDFVKGVKPRYSLHVAYKSDIKSTLYSDEDSAQMMIQSLSKPRVPGIAMKQVVEPLLPDGTVVIMDNKMYERAAKDAFGEDYHKYTLMHELRGCHVRNPSLWDSQFCKLKIWTQDDFRLHLFCRYGISLEQYLDIHMNGDILLISQDVLKLNHSDVDGDHSCVYIMQTPEGQRIVREATPINICEIEAKWHDVYIAGERTANNVLIDVNGKLVKHVYKLHQISILDKKVGRKVTTGYATTLINAVAAKENIGSSTNDSWVFAMLLECYQQYRIQHEGKYIVADNLEPKIMPRIRPEEFLTILALYKIALQDFVVTGVKHNDNGSKGFEIFFLRNMAKPENAEAIHKTLTTRLDATPLIASKILHVVTWASETGILKACNAFLRLYNKGQEPNEETQEILNTLEPFIQENTFFGLLLKDVYDVRKQSESKKVQTMDFEAFFGSNKSVSPQSPLDELVTFS